MSEAKQRLLEELQRKIDSIERSNASYCFELNSNEAPELSDELEWQAHETTSPMPQDAEHPAGDPFARIVKLVSFKERSSFGMRKRLLEEGYSQSDVTDAIRKAQRYAILDDARYAEMLVRSRYQQGRGAQRVERELSDEGISTSSVPLFHELYECDDTLQVERALDLLRRRPSRSKNPYAASIRKLVSNGYSYQIATAATRAWLDETLIPA